jgi:4-aminobutyrate---pyruvate transaminase
VCDKYDLLMIADEVITGFGRLGRMFGSDAVGYKPHAISVAKALSSAYLPIAAVMVPQRMHDALVAESRKIGTFGHGFTYSGHPVAAAVALKTMEIIARDRIVDKVAALAPQFAVALRQLGEHPLVGEARGLGLIGGLELVADKPTKRSFDPAHGVAARCVAAAQDEGLIVRYLAGDTVSLCPPLIISPQELGEMFERLRRALDRTLAWAHGAGLTKV